MELAWTLPYPSQRSPLLAANAVATSQPLAVAAGVQMLRAGGNAVDAALAAAITLTVVEPTGNGIGGDVMAMVWDGTDLVGLNGSGRSPAAWNRKRFEGCQAMPTLGWDAVTVPGAVAAWADLWRRFGRLPFADLFAPAIAYARNGFAVSPIIASRWAEAQDRYRGFGPFAATFLPQGKAPRAGQRFCCPDQATTLAEIAASQGESFYRGPLARTIAEHAMATGGALTLEDLQAHQTEWVTPLGMDYCGITLCELPPNTQGIAALIALGILAHHDLGRYRPDSPESIHLQVEAMKAAFGLVLAHVADPEAMILSTDQMLDPRDLANLAGAISMDRAAVGPPSATSAGGTVYLTAADAAGMMVSLIQSNYWGFGSGIVVPGTGISLHGRAAGFCLTPGHPNEAGGAKQPYHTIIPGFVLDKGRPLMSLGVMGAHMQPQGHVQLIVRFCHFGQNPQAALDAPRWHLHADGTLSLEPGIDPAVAQALRRRGHRVVENAAVELFGGGQVILKTEAGYCAASDWRKDGQAAGF